MIPQVKIKNFQSHVNAVLDFHPGVNFITGPSDAGKSAVIRALQWITCNEPTGDEYRRHNTSMTEVELKGVKKYRSASKHQYELNGRVFKALRTDVPPEVEQALRLSEVSFQSQHAPYFLIPEPAGQVAKTLNKVADLQVIDLTLAAVRARSREAKTQGKYLEEELKTTTKKIEALQWAVEADLEYQEIERLEAEAAAVDVSSLKSLIEKIERLQEAFDRIPHTVLDRAQISDSLKSLDIDLSLAGVIKKVEDNQVKIPDSKEDLRKVTGCITDLRADETSGVETAILKVEESQKDVSQFPEVIDGINEPLEDLILCTNAHIKLEESILEAFVAEDCADEADRMFLEGKMEFDRKLKEVGRCPLCERLL